MRSYYASAVGAIAAIGALFTTTTASAYNDDYFNPNYAYPNTTNKMQEYHSTFHYEFTRTLLRAAGFTADEAEKAAVTCQATDWQLFTSKTGSAMHGYFVGYTGLKVSVNNTSRIDVYQSRFWHFPRRAASTSTPSLTYPAVGEVSGIKSNTCDYFSTSNVCKDPKKPELSIIDDWAINGNSRAISGAGYSGISTPTVSVNGANQNPVAGKVWGFGVYLHSLADSFSHEACMKTNQLNYHPEQESKDSATYSTAFPQCSSENVHGNFRATTEVPAAEFNGGNPKIASYPNNDPTLPWTKAAGRAVYASARLFASKNLGTRTELWSEADRNTFIDGFAALGTATKRADCALKAWDSLAKGEKTPPVCQ